MWLRTLITTLALTCTFCQDGRATQTKHIDRIKDLICVLTLSGLQKEDLDVNTLKKLQQHNVNLDDLNNETTNRECLSNSNVELTNKKQAVSVEPTPARLPIVTESNLIFMKESKVTELPDIEKMIKYFETPQMKPVTRSLDSNVNVEMLKDERKDMEETKVTKVVQETATVRGQADNSGLPNPENLMNFLSMYSKFQQSQNKLNNIHNDSTATTVKEEQSTEKNNIFHITINKYIRNDSFIEQYFADNRNNKSSATKRQNFTSNLIMDKIQDFISTKLLVNEDNVSKEASNREMSTWNHIHKSSREDKDDKVSHSNLKRSHNGNEIIREVLNKISPQTLEEIVQALVIKGLIKTTTKQIAYKEPDKIPSAMLRNVIDDVKKMLLSELWNETIVNRSMTTSTAKAVTDETRGSFKTKSESVDPELKNFIKFFEKFKSWKEASSNSPSFESEPSKNRIDHSEETYRSDRITARKHKGSPKAKRQDVYESAQVTDTIINSDPLNPHGYPKYNEKNVITEDEEQLIERDSNRPLHLPYRAINSHKNKEVPADESVENDNLNTHFYGNRIPNHHVKMKYTKNKVIQHLKKNLNLQDDLNSNSIETKYLKNSKDAGIKNQVEDAMKNNPNIKRKLYLEVDAERSKGPEGQSDRKSANPQNENASSLESKGNYNAGSILNMFRDLNPNKGTLNPRKSPVSISSKSNGLAFNLYEPPLDGNKKYKDPEREMNNNNYPSLNIIKDAKVSNIYVPNKTSAPDDGRNINSVPVYNAYAPQNYAESSLGQEQIGNLIRQANLNKATVYNQNAGESKDAGVQEPLTNIPNSAYNSYGAPNFSSQTHIGGTQNQMVPEVNVPNPYASASYPYTLPNYSINNKPIETHRQSNMPNADSRNAYNLYGAPNYYAKNNIGNLPVKMGGLQVSNPFPAGYPGALNYSRKNNIGGTQDQIREASGLNYSAQNNIGSMQEPGNMPNANPYADPQYSTKNNPREMRDPRTFSQDQIREASASYPNCKGYQSDPNYSAQNNIRSAQQTTTGTIPNINPYAESQYSCKDIPGQTRDPRTFSLNMANPNTYNFHGGTQLEVPTAPFLNPIANGGPPSQFNGIFSEKLKFPVIQDPMAEALIKNPNVAKNPNPNVPSVGPSSNPYLTQRYPSKNGQGIIGASLEDPYLRGRQDIVAPSLTSNILRDAQLPTMNNVQGGIISLQNNPDMNQYVPGSVPHFSNDANLNKQREPGTFQVVPSSTYGIHKPIEVPDSETNQARPPKSKDIKSERKTKPIKNENQYNTISKIYPITIAGETPPRPMPQRTEKVDQTHPIMLQTNDDEIMPLGIPIHIRAESKFHMHLIQNQHIVVTTTARPRSRIDHWNDYKLSKDFRSNRGKEKQKYNPSATPHHQKRVRPPMTHHDFEDFAQNDKPSNYYRELNDMRPRSDYEFESRLLHQSSRESVPDSQLYYNPEMQDVRYHRNHFDNPKKVSLFRNQERMHDSINTGHLTIAQRHQMPLKRPQVNFDDTHFQNFLKTQEKVNEMLERILATRPKSLSLEPIKSR